MSTKKAPPAGAPFAPPQLGGTGQEQCTSEPFVKNKGRVSSWRWYPAFFAFGMVFRLMVWYTRLNKSEFVERFPELSLFYRLSSPLDSEMICIFPYFCPCEESAREIREILCQSMQEKLPVASSLYLSIARYFIKKSCGIPFSFSC